MEENYDDGKCVGTLALAGINVSVRKFQIECSILQISGKEQCQIRFVVGEELALFTKYP